MGLYRILYHRINQELHLITVGRAGIFVSPEFKPANAVRRQRNDDFSQ